MPTLRIGNNTLILYWRHSFLCTIENVQSSRIWLVIFALKPIWVNCGFRILIGVNSRLNWGQHVFTEGIEFFDSVIVVSDVIADDAFLKCVRLECLWIPALMALFENRAVLDEQWLGLQHVKWGSWNISDNDLGGVFQVLVLLDEDGHLVHAWQVYRVLSHDWQLPSVWYLMRNWWRLWTHASRLRGESKTCTEGSLLLERQLGVFLSLLAHTLDLQHQIFIIKFLNEIIFVLLLKLVTLSKLLVSLMFNWFKLFLGLKSVSFYSDIKLYLQVRLKCCLTYFFVVWALELINKAEEL